VLPTAGRNTLVHTTAVSPTALSAVEPLTPTRIGSTTTATRNARKTLRYIYTLTTHSNTTSQGGFSLPECLHTTSSSSLTYTRPEDARTRHLQMRLIRPLPSIDVVKDRRDRLLVEEVSAAAQQLMRTPGQPAESQALPDTDYNTD
jgi:hypothetical protein